MLCARLAVRGPRAAALALALVTSTASSAEFQLLGQLPSGARAETVMGVSADGALLVGSLDSASGGGAFAWTDPTGLVLLGTGLRAALAADGRWIVAGPVGTVRRFVRLDVGPDGLPGTLDDAFDPFLLPSGGAYDGCTVAEADRDGDTVTFFCPPDLVPTIWRRRPPAPDETVTLPSLPPLFPPLCPGFLAGDGESLAGSLCFFLGTRNAWSWTRAGGVIPIAPVFATSTVNAVSEHGTIVGNVCITGDADCHAFRWTPNSGLGLLPEPVEAPHCDATDVSRDGRIVAGLCTGAAGTRVVRWRDGSLALLPLAHALPPGRAFAGGVRISGDGGAIFAPLPPAPPGIADTWAWRAGDPVLRSVRDDLAPSVVPAGMALDTSAISDDGRTIAGPPVAEALGAWRLVLDPLPLDPDGDGIPSASDDCPFVANPGQEDVGGVGSGSGPDGVGDACQCGDVNGDGRVTAVDAVLITRSLLIPPTATIPRQDLCDVGVGGSNPGTLDCSLADAVVIRRALLLPPTATILQTCKAADGTP